MSNWQLCAAFTTGQGGSAAGRARRLIRPCPYLAAAPPMRPADGALELAVPPAGDQCAEHPDRDAWHTSTLLTRVPPSGDGVKPRS